MDEFSLIEKIRKGFPIPEDITGIGDDCAIIPQHDGFETLISTDMLVEGSHFILDEISPFQLGWKSAAVNFSDIAAMGGKPEGSFLALALPSKIRNSWIDDFMDGYRTISMKYGIPLLGGDTTSSPDRLTICVTVMGKAGIGKAKRRSTAKADDLICVTGCLGDSAGGLAVVLKGYERHSDEEYLVEKHYLPEPRIEEGMILAGYEGVHAMMDISDGIGSDIRHIMKESGVGAIIDTCALPHSPQLVRMCSRHGLNVKDLSLEGGEDYELLFTVDPAVEKTLEVRHYVIGRITSDSSLEWKGSDKDYMGFRHF